MDLSNNIYHHERTKHIDIQHHFIREKVELKEVVLEHIPSTLNIADILTKGLSTPKFNHLKKKLYTTTKERETVESDVPPRP